MLLKLLPFILLADVRKPKTLKPYLLLKGIGKELVTAEQAEV